MFTYILICIASVLPLTSAFQGPNSHLELTDREAVIGALCWFNDWVRPVPSDHNNFVCAGRTTGQYGFVYCNPGRIEIDLWKSLLGTGISRTFVEADLSFKQVIDSLPLRFDGWRGSGNRVRWRITASEIAQSRRVDSQKTREFYERSKSIADKYAKSYGPGTSTYYQWVYFSSPEYEVYLAKGGVVLAVLRFDIESSRITDYPNFILDREHDNIPGFGSRYLNDANRWYTVVTVP